MEEKKKEVPCNKYWREAASPRLPPVRFALQLPEEPDDLFGRFLRHLGDDDERDGARPRLDDDAGERPGGRGARPACDVAVRDGAIVAVEPHVPGEAFRVIDGEGGLCVPSFVDSHTHLDKVLADLGLSEFAYPVG